MDAATLNEDWVHTRSWTLSGVSTLDDLIIFLMGTTSASNHEQFDALKKFCDNPASVPMPAAMKAELLDRFSLSPATMKITKRPPQNLDEHLTAGYNPDQARDERGRFGGEAGGRQVEPAKKEGYHYLYPDGSNPVPNSMVGKAAIRDMPGERISNSEMDKHYAKWAAGLTDAQRTAFTDYQVESFGLNRQLRRDGLDDVSPAKAEQVRQLDSAMESTNVGNKAIATYRVTTADFADGLKIGDKITDAGYISTTLDPSFAKEFAEIQPEDAAIVKVVVPAGAKAAWIDSASTTGQSTQSELLLPRNSTLLYMGQDDKGTHVFAAHERRK